MIALVYRVVVYRSVLGRRSMAVAYLQASLAKRAKPSGSVLFPISLLKQKGIDSTRLTSAGATEECASFH